MKAQLKQCVSAKEHQAKTFEKTSLSQPTSLYAIPEPQEAQTGILPLKLRPLKCHPVLSAGSKAFTNTTLTWLIRPVIDSSFNSLASQQYHS